MVQKDERLLADDDAAEVKLPFAELMRRMAREAVTPHKLGLLVIFLAAAAVCARLGVWQLDRAYERANLAKEHEIAEAADQSADPLGSVLKPQVTFSGSTVGKRVSFTGEFEADNQVLVTNRAVDDQNGFLVLNSVVVQDDGSQGQSWAGLSGNPRMPVVRGWVPADAVTTSGQLSNEWALKIAPPTGPVEITGWLQASESTLFEQLPAGQTNSISSAALANEWGGPIYGGYLVLQESIPDDAEALAHLPRPQIEGSEGLNTQNLFYALQWWVFGGFALALWLRLVRDDAVRASLQKPVNPFDILDAQA